MRWIPNVIAAVIMLQTLFFKFGAAPQSVALFEMLNILGMPEAFGRIGTGILELIAALLLFHKKTEVVGALMTFGIMSGALMLHFTILTTKGDNMPLTIMAGVAAACAAFIIFRRAYAAPETPKDPEEKEDKGGW